MKPPKIVFSAIPLPAGNVVRVDDGLTAYTVKACVDLAWISGGEWKGYTLSLMESYEMGVDTAVQPC